MLKSSFTKKRQKIALLKAKKGHVSAFASSTKTCLSGLLGQWQDSILYDNVVDFDEQDSNTL